MIMSRKNLKETRNTAENAYIAIKSISADVDRPSVETKILKALPMRSQKERGNMLFF